MGKIIFCSTAWIVRTCLLYHEVRPLYLPGSAITGLQFTFLRGEISLSIRRLKIHETVHVSYSNIDSRTFYDGIPTELRR